MLRTFFATLLLLSVSAQAETQFLRPGTYSILEVDADLSNCHNGKIRDVLTVKEEAILGLCEKDYLKCLNEGSCMVSDGQQQKLINVVAVNPETMEGRWKEVNPERCPYGLGVKNICLDPYHSVAADSEVFKAGDVIFVSGLVGASLPNNEVHDGYFVVRDFNRYLKGTEGRGFLFFDGQKRGKEKTHFEKLGLDAHIKFEFEKASAEKAAEIRAKRNFPSIPGADSKGRLYK